MKKPYKIIIAGDLIPSGKNVGLYESGDAEKIFGKEMFDLFHSADFSIVNYEGALTDSNIAQRKVGPNIKAPTATVKGIKNLGVKAVALANNHITDFGNTGYADTVKTFEQAGIEHLGAGPCKSLIKTHISVNYGEGNFCIYNVSETFFNVPDDNNAGVNIYDEWLVCNEIKRLKETHDYLIVIYHGGAEQFQYPTPQTRRRFHRMAECGADLITSQHTHCIGCEEFYNNSYLLYGQGNFSFVRKTNKLINRLGLVLEVTLGNTVEIKKHRVEMSDDDCLVYSANQSLSDFYERSAKIDDEEFVINEYKKVDLIQNRFTDRYLRTYRGVPMFVKKILPNKLWRKWANLYTSGQILCNIYAVESDRVREDLMYCWYGLREKNKKRYKILDWKCYGNSDSNS